MAAEVTKADTEMRSFQFPVKWFWLPLRLAVGVFRPRLKVLGGYFAGVVDQLGPDVTRYAVGDEVFGSAGMGFGAHAEFLCVPETTALAPKPSNASFAEAAAMLLGGWNALHFMNLADVQPDEQVLVNGAGGSIGSFAVQIAKARGAVVTVVDKAEKAAMLSAQGADHFVDYRREDFTTLGPRFNVVLDMVAASPFSRCASVVAAGGRYLLGNPRLSDMLRASWMSWFSDRRARFRFARETEHELRALVALCEAGHIEPLVDTVYPLEEAAEAHRRVETEERVGAIILEPHRKP